MSENIRIMFDRIAGKYDLMNGILSAGVHKKWRRVAAGSADFTNNAKILDLATGTGDLAFEFERKCSTCHITGLDFSEEMLVIARRKADRRASRVNFISGDAMDLPFADASFDVIGIAYGIRNTDDPLTVLREMRRVTKPGGSIVILEFGKNKGFARLLNLVAFRFIMPIAGAVFAGNTKAYSYLQDSSARFPGGDDFLKIMREAGISDLSCRNLSLGITYLYSGKA